MFVLSPKSRIATSGPPSDGIALVARRRRRDLGDEVLVLPARHGSGERASLFGIGLAGRGHDGAQAAVRAEVAGQGAGVDAGDGRDPRLAQHRGQLSGAVEDRGGGVGHDQAAQPGSLGLVVEAKPAVVADERVGHDHELARVAGIGGDLLVAGLAGVHHQIALAAAPRAEGDAREDRPSSSASSAGP